jgi:hypothetical protein
MHRMRKIDFAAPDPWSIHRTDRTPGRRSAGRFGIAGRKEDLQLVSRQRSARFGSTGRPPAESTAGKPLVLRVTMHPFPWRYRTGLGRPVLLSGGNEALPFYPSRVLGVTNLGFRFAVCELRWAASFLRRLNSSSSAQTIQCLPEGVLRE